MRQLDYNSTRFLVCQVLFLLFLTFFFDQVFLIAHNRTCKRRRRDLNPRAAINDLHPFQGCPFGPLGYFSRWQNLLDSVKLYCVGTGSASMCCIRRETEKVGFEPTVPFGITGFQDQLLKPLGHLSVFDVFPTQKLYYHLCKILSTTFLSFFIFL